MRPLELGLYAPALAANSNASSQSDKTEVKPGSWPTTGYEMPETTVWGASTGTTSRERHVRFLSSIPTGAVLLGAALLGLAFTRPNA